MEESFKIMKDFSVLWNVEQVAGVERALRGVPEVWLII